MVGDDYGLRASLNGLQRARRGHYALDDERHLCVADYLAHLLNGLAAGVGIHSLEEGQTRAVNIHRRGKNALGVEDIKLFKHGFLVPRLNSRAAHAADLDHVFGCGLHYVGVDAVAGQSHDAVFRRGLDEDGVILLILVLRAVVHVDRAEGSGEDRRGEFVPEQLKGDVGIGEVLAERIHVDAYLLPLVIVARRGVAGELAAGAGHGVAAGAAVADGTCLAVGAYALSCGAENFVVIHDAPLHFFIFCLFGFTQLSAFFAGMSTPVRSKSGIISSVAESGSCQ